MAALHPSDRDVRRLTGASLTSTVPSAPWSNVPRSNRLVDIARTREQLFELSSSLALPHEAAVSALVHVAKDYSASDLSTLLDRLSSASQTLSPRRIVVLPHKDVAARAAKVRSDRVMVADGYSGSSARAVLEAARGYAAADFIVVMDADDASALDDRRYIEAMVHAAGTTEFSAAVLASSGAIFVGPRGRASVRPICRLEHSAELHLPTGPYLLQGSWLASAALVSGLRTDLAHGAALALALRRKAGIHAFALPISDVSSHAKCPPLDLPKDRDVVKSIANEYAVEPLVDTDRSVFANSADFLSGTGAERVTVVVESAGDLRLIGSLACAIASHASAAVEIVSFGADVGRGKLDCLLDVRRAASLSQVVKHSDVVLTLAGRKRVAAELQQTGGWFADAPHAYTVDSARTAKVPTVIALPEDQLVSAAWIGQLPTEALRRASADLQLY